MIFNWTQCKVCNDTMQPEDGLYSPAAKNSNKSCTKSDHSYSTKYNRESGILFQEYCRLTNPETQETYIIKWFYSPIKKQTHLTLFENEISKEPLFELILDKLMELDLSNPAQVMNKIKKYTFY